MARRSIISPWALGQPSSTSVRLPTASWGRPFHRAAISPRSSATPTRWGAICTPSEAMRIRSRRRVVLPAPGGARMRVLSRHPSGPVSLSHTGSAAPRPWRATRTEAEDRFRRLKISPPRRTAVPHSPTRCPPLHGQIPPAQLVQHRVDRGPAGQLQQLLQVPARHRLPAQGPLPLREDRRQGLSAPEPQLLRPPPGPQGGGSAPPAADGWGAPGPPVRMPVDCVPYSSPAFALSYVDRPGDMTGGGFFFARGFRRLRAASDFAHGGSSSQSPLHSVST